MRGRTLGPLPDCNCRWQLYWQPGTMTICSLEEGAPPSGLLRAGACIGRLNQQGRSHPVSMMQLAAWQWGASCSVMRRERFARGFACCLHLHNPTQ